MKIRREESLEKCLEISAIFLEKSLKESQEKYVEKYLEEYIMGFY